MGARVNLRQQTNLEAVAGVPEGAVYFEPGIGVGAIGPGNVGVHVYPGQLAPRRQRGHQI